MIYGDLTIHALPEGRFTVGLDKLFVPHAEGDPPRPGTLFISVTPFLVRTPAETLLIDTGLGAWATGRGTEQIAGALAAHGVGLEAVDRVVLSHLHFDHSGGALTPMDAPGASPADVREWRPTFPRASYVVQRAEATADGYADESARARDLVLETLDREGQVEWVDGDADLGTVALTVTGGHTGAHQMVTLRSGALAAVYGGDVLGTPGSALRRYVAKYDTDGEASARWRERIAREAAEAGHLLLFYHSPSDVAAFLHDGPDGRGRLAIEGVAL